LERDRAVQAQRVAYYHHLMAASQQWRSEALNKPAP
jgi:hypothetical protein